jgi:hypothetical protein
MTDFKQALARFSAHQAEREAWAKVELQRLKQAVIPALQQAGIAQVEILFDGYGDSGAVEEIVCLDAADATLACPDTMLDPVPNDSPDGADCADPMLLPAALESIAYLALERHHPGWENNDGAGGKLEIDVGAATFVLECNLRFTDYTQYSTDL